MTARSLGLLGLLAVSVACAGTLPLIEPGQAARHIGERAQVCGVVASTKFAGESTGKPTFLNLGQPFPNHVFTAVVWGTDLPSFPYALDALQGEHICVVGEISEFRDKPQIVVSRPSQIRRLSDS